MTWKKTIGVVTIFAMVTAAIFAYKSDFAAATEPESTLRADLFSTQYEKLVPDDWYTVTKLNGNLTRQEAAYLVVNTYAKAIGTSPDWLNYKTKLKDTSDPMLSRAVDYGLMSVDQTLKFNGAKPISQQEYAVICTKLVRALNHYKKPTVALAYKDASKVAPWAKESVQYLQQNGLVGWASKNQFEPEKNITMARALSLANKLLVKEGVYSKRILPAVKSQQQFTVKGFKLPKPIRGLTEWEMSVNESDHLVLTFSGVIKNRTLFDTKLIMAQLIESLDSNSRVSYAAQATVTALLRDSFDSSSQSFQVAKEVYVSLDSGLKSEAEPSGGFIYLKAGQGIVIEIKP